MEMANVYLGTTIIGVLVAIIMFVVGRKSGQKNKVVHQGFIVDKTSAPSSLNTRTEFRPHGTTAKERFKENPPMGYRFSVDGIHLVVDKEERSLIEAVHSLRDGGHDAAWIADKFMRDCVTTRRRTKWYASLIEKISNRPIGFYDSWLVDCSAPKKRQAVVEDYLAKPTMKQATQTEVAKVATKPKSGAFKKRKTEYYGVQQISPTKYSATASANGKNKYLGSFTSPVKAARAHDRYLIANGGMLGYLNFPLSYYQQSAKKKKKAVDKPKGTVSLADQITNPEIAHYQR